MTRTDLVLNLIKLRLKRLARSEGATDSEAEARVIAFLKSQDLEGMTFLATPEGSIVTIVETYVNSIGQWMLDSGLKSDSPNFNAEFKRANALVIDEIERRRSIIQPGSSSYPKDIDEYVFYRLGVEIRFTHGVEPEVLGFDKKTVKILTHTAKRQFARGSVIVGALFSGGTEACFVATVCFDGADASEVRTLRRYRDVILKRSKAGRCFVRLYYRYGSSLAVYVAKRPILLRACRRVLLKTAYYLSRKYGL